MVPFFRAVRAKKGGREATPQGGGEAPSPRGGMAPLPKGREAALEAQPLLKGREATLILKGARLCSWVFTT